MSSASKQSETDKVSSATDSVVTLRNPSAAVAKAPEENRIVRRLRKSGLDPQKLLDLALPGAVQKSTLKLRHRLIVLCSILFVVLPSAAFTGYMLFWASDQYHSTAAFAVRSSNQSMATEILGMVLNSGGDSTSSNSYIVYDYIQSQAILEDIRNDIDLDAIYNAESADWLFRMGSDLPIEDQLKYWNSMIDVNYDATSGVIYVDVRSFSPEDSVRIAGELVERSEMLVNKLSDANRRQTMRYAEETLARAEAGLKAIRRQIESYRDFTQEVSPEDAARIAMELIAELDSRVVQKQAELKTLSTYLDDTSPRIKLLQQEVGALQAQIQTERQRLGAGVGDRSQGDTPKDRLSARIASYTELKLEEEFANQFYSVALANLERARQDATQNQMYLAKFISPTLSEQAQYPQRILYSLAFFLILAGAWVVIILMYYNIRDRT